MVDYIVKQSELEGPLQLIFSNEEKNLASSQSVRIIVSGLLSLFVAGLSSVFDEIMSEVVRMATSKCKWNG